jgi:regulator of sigma E protease
VPATLLVGALAFLAMIVIVVGIHELGHFATAKWSGIRVDEFAIGFGPRLWSRQRGETVYSLRALPLGGFVKMPGMSTLEQDDGGPRGFMHAPVGRQVIVLVAGVTMNFLLAGLLFGILRIPDIPSVVPTDGRAYAAGMRDGDAIVAVAGRQVDTSSSDAIASALHSATDQSRGAPLAVTYRRASDSATVTTQVAPSLVLVAQDASQQITAADGTQVDQVVVLSINGSPVNQGDPGALLGGGGPVRISGFARGSSPHDATKQVTGTVSGVTSGRGALGAMQAAWYVGYAPGLAGEPVPQALVHGYTSLPGEIAANVRAIWDLFTTPNSGGVTRLQGPVGIAHDASSAAQQGWLSYLDLVALISMSLGIINILPIPPFDGGRVVLVLRQAVMRRGSGARLEMALIAAGALLIGTLAIVITINDIKGL